jgi:DNA-directed RNA polymerase specialized sigma24 family protein
MAVSDANLPLEPLIAAGLASLAPLEAEVVVLVYFDRRSQRQVADHLAIPIATVAAAASRGLQALARFLENRNIAPDEFMA